ncbi:unnamed protein product [Effrenium voratum]|uniref:glucan 1,4-alpha-glucosidase n=1 Tax=Effrenium voratum TaxID=2562239 RepID=A0AA36N5D8_9DINO|nr:unnamed protein product [Effrenium voratum]
MFRAAVAGLLIPAAAVECEQVQLGDRVDCTRMDEDSCRAAGCCWGPVSPNPGNAPWCFFSNRTLQSCTLGGDAKARYPMRAFTTHGARRLLLRLGTGWGFEHARLQTKGAGAEKGWGTDPNDVDILVEPKCLIPQARPTRWLVAANHSSETCDLWEEVRSSDFFWNRYTMRKALSLGQDCGRRGKMSEGGQSTRRATRRSTAGVVTSMPALVFESTDRRKDTAVIGAFSGGLGDGLDGPFRHSGGEDLCERHGCKSLRGEPAGGGFAPGVLFGRYEGDSYDGGNPWVLLTASAATLLYRQAQALAKGGSMDADAKQVLHQLLGREVTQQNLLGAGDALLLLMKKYLTNGMHMNEQIDRNDGSLKSAKDLTWNYANVLKAIAARKAAAATETLVI